MRILTAIALSLAFFCNSYAKEKKDTPEVFYPVYCHQLKSITCLGDELEVEDGSLWEVSPSDSHKLFLWSTDDTLVIYPIRDVFSYYYYRVKNLSTEQSVDVKLKSSSLDTKLTYKIDSLDYENNEMKLSDGSTWKINRWDTNYKNWMVGDYILIGLNETSLFASEKFILINTSENSYIRANAK